MKKVTLTFVVNDNIVNDVMNDLTWGGMGNVAEHLQVNCETSKYDIEDCDENGSDGYFVVTRLHREDLEEAGFDASNVSNETMERLADKMGDDYVSQLFWEHLPVFAEYLDIPTKDDENEEEG